MRLALYFPSPAVRGRESVRKWAIRASMTPSVELIDADTGEVLGYPESADFSEGFDSVPRVSLNFLGTRLGRQVTLLV